MNYINVAEIIDEIKEHLKSKEYEYAKLKIEEAFDFPNITDKLKSDLEILKSEIDKLSIKDNEKTDDINEIFERAFLLNDFYPDFFIDWIYKTIETKIFELSKKHLEILANFFINKKINNQHKCFVLESLFFLKFNIEIIFLNNKLKTVDKINTIDLNTMPCYLKSKKVNEIIQDLTMKEPSLKNLANMSWESIFAYTFPMEVNFPEKILAEYIVKYVKSKLSKEDAFLFSDLKDKNLVNFIYSILEKDTVSEDESIIENKFKKKS